MSDSAVARTAAGRVTFEEIHAYCVAHADDVRARRYARFFTEGYDAYGVDYRHPSWDKNRLDWTGRLRAAGPDAFTECAERLVCTGKYEETSFAILIAADLPEFDSREIFEAIGGWFDCEGIRNWAHTDVLCKMVLSRYVRNGTVALDDFRPWRDSSVKFKRRAVAVALVESIDHRDLSTWLPFLEPFMQDSEKVVHQGMGWFLREAWKREPERIEPFLLQWKDTAPRLILQYATEKMKPIARAKFRRSRK